MAHHQQEYIPLDLQGENENIYNGGIKLNDFWRYLFYPLYHPLF